MFKIGELAQLTGLTIRTLRHYDEIGLLKPAHRDPSGYRRYSRENLLRLQQIMLFRELEMPLEDIKKILSKKDFAPADSLKNHQKALQEKRSRIDLILITLSKTIQHLENNMPITEQELYEGLNQTEIDAIKTEVDSKWDSKIVAESRRRTSQMTKKQWSDTKINAQEIEMAFAKSMHLPVENDAVQALVTRHHAWIETFYPCDKTMYAGLAELYVSDERFKAHYEKIAPGLADFLSKAMKIWVGK